MAWLIYVIGCFLIILGSLIYEGITQGRIYWVGVSVLVLGIFSQIFLYVKYA